MSDANKLLHYESALIKFKMHCFYCFNFIDNTLVGCTTVTKRHQSKIRSDFGPYGIHGLQYSYICPEFIHCDLSRHPQHTQVHLSVL